MEEDPRSFLPRPARVVEAGAVRQERDVAVKGLRQPVRQVRAGIHVLETDLDFVLARLPEQIGDELAVAGDVHELGIGRVIGGQRRGVEQDLLGALEPLSNADDGQVRVRPRSGVEVAAAFDGGNAQAVGSRQLREPAAEIVLAGRPREKGAREPIFRVDEGARVGGVEILQPVVRVRQRDAVERLLEGDAAGQGRRRALLAQRHEGKHAEREESGGGSSRLPHV